MIDSVRTYQAIDIASETESVCREKVDDITSIYRKNNWTYMPLIEEREYYNVDEEEYGKIEEGQFISGGLDILETMKKLKENPFLLIKNKSGLHIVTVSDLNSRKVKEMAYPIIGEMEELLAKHIKERYSSEELNDMNEVDDNTKKRWRKAKNRNVNLHLSEYLSSYEMEKIVKNKEEMRQKTDLDKYENPGKMINKASKVRNKVAHGNRSLIYNEKRIKKVEKRLEYAEKINQTLRE